MFWYAPISPFFAFRIHFKRIARSTILLSAFESLLAKTNSLEMIHRDAESFARVQIFWLPSILCDEIKMPKPNPGIPV